MRAIWVVSACAALGACSPYVFKDQIGKFGDGITRASDSYDQGKKDLVVEQRYRTRVEWTYERQPLGMDPGCGDDGKKCTVSPLVLGTLTPHMVGPSTTMARLAQDDREKAAAAAAGKKDACDIVGAPAIPDPVKSKEKARGGEGEDGPLDQEQVFKDFLKYVAGLQAVTNAKDKADFNDAKDQLSSSVGKFVSNVGIAFGGIGAAAGPIATAATDTVLWLVGTALDHRRLAALREATTEACRPVKVLSDVIVVVVETQRGAKLRMLNGTIYSEIKNLNRMRSRVATSDQIYSQNLDLMLANLDAYEAARDVDPIALKRGIDNAHDALVLAIYNNDGQFTAVVTALDELTKSVDKLVKATQAGSQQAAK